LRTRYRNLVAEVSGCAWGGRTPRQLCHAAAECLENARRDLPFILVYLLDPDGKSFRLEAAAGIAEGHPAAPVMIHDGDPVPWPLGRVERITVADDGPGDSEPHPCG
jgi:hypothetical protein